MGKDRLPCTPSASATVASLTVPVHGAPLEKGRLSTSPPVNDRLETAPFAQVGMVVQDRRNRVGPSSFQPVTVTSGTGTASFTAATTVRDTAQRIIVYFALFADGKTVTRTVDSVQYLVRN